MTYDGNGNILSTLTNGITTTYDYSSTYPNLLLATYTAGQPAATYYSYDGTGHVLSITNTLTGTMGISDSLGYDLQGRLVAVGMKDGTLVSWGYNSAGQRFSYTVSKAGAISLQQTFQYRNDELADATISTTAGYTTDSYLYDQNGNPLELIRVPRGGAPQRYWYAVDGRGNVVALTDLTGTVVDRYSYDAWGAPTSISETVPQRLRYAGYWYDQELGTYWVSVREYAPTLKRWLAPDPSQQDGVRTYVYAGDDPIDLIDQSGQASGATTPSATSTPVPCSAYKARTVCEGRSPSSPPRATATPGPTPTAPVAPATATNISPLPNPVRHIPARIMLYLARACFLAAVEQ